MSEEFVLKQLGDRCVAKIYDISMTIREGMLTYPGDPSPKIDLYSRIPKEVTNESLIKIGSHTGTHVDAGRHISNTGYTADKIALNSCIGKCEVVDLTRCGDSIHEKDLIGRVGKSKIVLLKTNNSLKQYDRFRKDFAHVAADAAKYLVRIGVKTLGIDYLSVKKFNKDDDVHALIIKNMTLFEGLYLKGIRGGKYTFVGLPLRMATDGSPARAILVKGL